MVYSVILVNGGDYSNIDAPLAIDGANFCALEKEIISSFELDTNSKLILSYCGEVLKGSSRLPRDGATILASVKNAGNQSCFVQSSNPPTQNTQFDEAYRFLRHHQSNARSPIRERLRLVIESHLEKRYISYPDFCRTDIDGARLCSNYDLFMASALVDKKVAQNHEIIQLLLIEIFKEVKAKLASTMAASSGAAGPSIVPFGGLPTVPSVQQPNRAQSSNRSTSLITPQMLSQALSAAAGNIPTPATNAANTGMMNEVAALSKAVDNGIRQLREMGILAQTTESNARRILQENGGNVEAAVNRILESLYK